MPLDYPKKPPPFMLPLEVCFEKLFSAAMLSLLFHRATLSLWFSCVTDVVLAHGFHQRSRNASKYFTGHRASNRNLWLKSVPYTANANSLLVAVCEILLGWSHYPWFLTPGGGPCVSVLLDVGYPLFVQHNECLKDWTNQCFPHMNLSQDSLRCCACVRPWAVAVQVVPYRGSPSFELGAKFSFIAQTLRPFLAYGRLHARFTTSGAQFSLKTSLGCILKRLVVSEFDLGVPLR